MAPKSYDKLKHSIRYWLLRTLPTCQQTVEKISQSMERPLTFRERINVKLHLWICAWCQWYLEDLAGERSSLLSTDSAESWQWHGTQTSVAAAGNGQLSNGVYRGLAHDSKLVLVKVSERGRITEENIAQGIQWIIANRERYNIRVLNISL